MPLMPVILHPFSSSPVLIWLRSWFCLARRRSSQASPSLQLAERSTQVQLRMKKWKIKCEFLYSSVRETVSAAGNSLNRIREALLHHPLQGRRRSKVEVKGTALWHFPKHLHAVELQYISVMSGTASQVVASMCSMYLLFFFAKFNPLIDSHFPALYRVVFSMWARMRLCRRKILNFKDKLYSNPFLLILNVPLILKTGIHLQFPKISVWPIWLLIDPL